jgi:hypothetical protein
MIWRSTLRAFIPLAALAIAVIAVMAPIGGTDVQTDDPAAGSAQYYGQAGMRAHIDPETGRIAAGPAAAAPVLLDPATRDALRRDAEGLVEEYHADGSVSIHLQGRFQSATIAHIGEDGRVTICTDDEHHAQSVLDGNVAGEQTAEVK